MRRFFSDDDVLPPRFLFHPSDEELLELPPGFLFHRTAEELAGVPFHPTEEELQEGTDIEQANGTADTDENYYQKVCKMIVKMLVDPRSTDNWQMLIRMFLAYDIAHIGFSSWRYTLNDSSPSAKPPLHFPIDGVFNAVALLPNLIAAMVYPKKKEAAVIMGKIGISATLCGFIVKLGLMFLPQNMISIISILILCFMARVGIFLA